MSDKGKVYRSSRKQAAQVLRDKLALREPRHGNKQSGKIHSIGTFNTYVDALAQVVPWQRAKNDDLSGLISLIDNSKTPEEAKAQANLYLLYRSEQVHQKQLNKDRQALCMMLGRNDLIRPKSELDEIQRVTRAYSRDQIIEIIKHQTHRNALSTRIALVAGPRAHEFLTIQRADELEVSRHRVWRSDLFVGRTGVIYLVVGKGGLTRAIMIPYDLAEQLEETRLSEPIEVIDRKIKYLKHYDIGGGQAWSQSFGDASVRCLGWSNGGHGARHTYVHERMMEVKAHGYVEREAERIVSQELGHFRPEILSFYYR